MTHVAAGAKADPATAVSLQTNDRAPALRAGRRGPASASNSDFAVARYWP